MCTQINNPGGNEISMKNIRRHLSVFLISLLLLTTAHTKGSVTNDIVEIFLGTGYYGFDNRRDIEDTVMTGAGIGLHLSRRWAFFLQYSSLNTAVKVNGVRKHLDMQKYHVDVHRFFNVEKPLRPYLVVGFGQMDLVSDGSASNKNMINAGLGISYNITPAWSVRTDARIFSRVNNDYHDSALTLTLGYRFNGGEK